jgi:hypothetical protein
MIDNELEFDRLAEGGEKTFLSAKKKRMMVSLFKGSGSRDKIQIFDKKITSRSNKEPSLV